MEELHIKERIDEVLNILNNIPLRGYDQWNPVVAAMQKLAALSQDYQKHEEGVKDEEHPAE